MVDRAPLRILAYGLFISALLLVLVCPPAGAALPTVVIGDLDHDGRYTGADVNIAIQQCKPGCVLQALPVVYDDVEAWIGPNMPNGIILQGAGVGKTLFRAPVPQVGPVVRVSEAPPNVALRDFTVDGRQPEQTTAAINGEGSGIAIASPYGTNSPPGLIERVEVANLLRAGIVVRDAQGWEIRNSQIHDIGCDLDILCPSVIPPAPDPYVQGRKTAGIGISVTDAGADGTVVHDNTVWNVTKIGIEAYDYVASQPPANFWFYNNHVMSSAEVGIVANGATSGRIENNLVEQNGGTGIRGNDGAGIGCSGMSKGISITGNTLRNNEGPGLNLGCQGPVTASGNTVQGDCTKSLGNFGEIDATMSASGSGLVLNNNSVSRPTNGTGCRYALAIEGWSNVTVSGGSYQGGSLAGVYLCRSQQIAFSNVTIDGGGGPGFFIQRDVSGVQIDSSNQVTHPNGPLVTNIGASNVSIAQGIDAPRLTVTTPGQPQLVSTP